jgi:catechol 2,3-dioxygenase-like lactoylglutathione lyase family enzyme
VKSTVAMLVTPDGQTKIEFSQFHTPPVEGDAQNLPVNTIGIRHIAFLVEDIDGLVATLKKRGTKMFSEVQNYEDIYKLCYVHGPEGIIVELAEELR